MKKLASFLLILAMVFALLPATAFASDAITVTIDGEPVDFDGQEPILSGGRTLVPVRGVFEALGFVPTWNPTAMEATLTRDDYVVVLTIGSYTFTTNGVEFPLDVPAQLIGGRTLLPLRAVLESVGYNDMDWIPSTRTVVIYTGAAGQSTSGRRPALVGTWAWEDVETWQYVFRADGRGAMNEMAIGWTSNNGVLAVCTTPDFCGATCIAPMEWYYEIVGSRLTLTSRTVAGMIYSYNRVN